MTFQIIQTLIESGWLATTLRSFVPLSFLLVVWMVILSIATHNVRVLRRKTAQLTLSALVRHPQLNDAAIWRRILPQWEEMVCENAFVLPDRFQLWVQRATPDRAARLLGFGPGWVAAVRAGTLVGATAQPQPADAAGKID